MENQYQERSGVIGGFAKVLNAGGSAAVFTYDMTASGLTALFNVAKKAPVLPDKVIGLFTKGFKIVKPTEIKTAEDKISEYEMKIKKLHFEIGKEGASYSGDESPLETEPIKKLIADVREYEKEIQRLREHITEIVEQKKAEALKRQELKKEAAYVPKIDKVTEGLAAKKVESAIGKALKQGKFQSQSEREIFDKVANDLLDSEMEIKILASAELGKIGNKAAVPILMEAVKFSNPDLAAEIISSLITIGDSRAISLFKEEISSPKHQVRVGCIRGLYKLAKDEEAVSLLTESLRDEHPKVRSTAATFIGWKDYKDAVPALVQCLRDEDTAVRKAAVSALANIKDDSAVLPLIKVLGDKDLEIREKAFEAVRVISGEEITFDINASGTALKEAINDLRDWWQQERMGKLGLEEETATVEEAAAEAEEAAPEAEEPEEVSEEEGEEEAEAAEGTAEPEEAEEAAPPSEEPELTEDSLMKMTKAELVSLCEERGIECDEKHTKSEIRQLILGEGE